MSPFKKFWPREMFKFRNPLDYSITEDDSQNSNNRQVNNKQTFQPKNPYDNLLSMQAPNMPISSSLDTRRVYNPEFERDYQKTRYYNPMQSYQQNLGRGGFEEKLQAHQSRNPYKNPELFQQFEQLNQMNNTQQLVNQYQDPRSRLGGQHLQGLNQYGLLNGHSKDEIISEDEGWDLNDLPRPINHYRNVLPTMQYKPEHEPKQASESDEIQF